MFKKRKAIDILNRHLTELNTVTTVQQGNTWKASLKDTLDINIGPESSISTRLDDLHFTRKEAYIPKGVRGVFDKHVYDETKKEHFRHLIENAIRHIESNGVYVNHSKSNFLSGFDNAQIIGGIVVAAGSLFAVGNYLGKFEKEREIIQLNKDIDSRDEQIKMYEEGRDSEMNTIRIENKNLKDTYEKIYNKNDSLNKVVEDLKTEIKKLKTER
jgi:cell division protein FtsB